MIGNRLKGLSLGILAAIGVTLVFDFLPSGITAEIAGRRLGGFFFVSPAVFGLPKIVVAMFVGAYISKTDFVGPAVSLSIIGSVAAIYFLNQIAHAAGQHSLADVIAMNSIGTLIGISGAIFGAIAGRRFYNLRHDDAPEATETSA